MEPADPIRMFTEAFARAKARETSDPTAMTLATADASGRPSARMVLLKGVDERGFVFYTNRESRKARELDQVPFAALCIHWPVGEEQVRVEGRVERIADDESDAYFATRPRGSQIGAWASRQSQPLAAREELEARIAELEERFAGKPVPRPPFWGGYRVVPDRLELWKGLPSRLHERLVFVREGAGWRTEHLYP